MVGRAVSQLQQDGSHVGHQVLVGQDHALGVAGGTGGVADGGQVLRLRRLSAGERGLDGVRWQSQRGDQK